MTHEEFQIETHILINLAKSKGYKRRDALHQLLTILSDRSNRKIREQTITEYRKTLGL